MKLKKVIPRAILWTIGGIGIILIVLFSLLSYVQTEPGRQRLVEWLAGSVGQVENISIRYGRLEGYIPFDFRLDRLEISDREGQWLGVSDLTCRISPSALLHGRLHIKEFGAALIALDRIPASAPGRQQPEGTEFSLPDSLLPVRVERLQIGRLALGETVLGEKAVFTVSAQMKTSVKEHKISSFLRINRIQGPAAQADIRASLRGPTPALTLDVRIQDREGRFVGNYLGIEPLGLTSVRLIGQGPLTQWRGRLSAQAENLGALNAPISFSRQDNRFRIAAEGPVHGNRTALPHPFSAIEGLTEGQFKMDIEYRPPGALAVHTAEWKSAPASVSLTGRHNLKDQVLSLELNGNVEDLGRFEPLLQTGISGRADIAGQVSGNVRRPKGHFRVRLFDVAYDRYRASRLTTDIDLKPSASGENLFQLFHIRSEGDAKGVELGFRDIPIGDSMSWSLNAQVQDGERITIEKFAINAGAANAEGSGRMDLNQGDFKAGVILSIPQLHPLSPIIQTGIHGKAILRNRLEGNFVEKRIVALMEGRLEDLQFEDPRLSSLLGKSMAYQSRMTGRLPHLLSLETLQITTSGIEAKAWIGSMDLSTGAMQGGGQIRIPALGAFSTMIGRQMEGPLDATVNVGGTLQSPRLKAEASSPHIIVNGFDCRDISVAVEGEDLRKRPKGRYTIRLHHEKQRLQGSGDYELGPERVNLSGLILNAPKAHFNGDLEIRFDPLLVMGSLNGKAEDLSPLSPFLGEQIRGDALLDARFSKSDSAAQDINMDFASRALAIGSAHLKDIKIKLKLADAFGTPGGTASINVARLSKGDLALEAASFTAEGRKNRASFRGEASGRFRRSFEIRTDGSFLQAADKDRLDIDTITGRFGTLPFKLAEPLRLVHQNRQLNVDKVALSVGSGLLTVSGGIQPDQIDLETTLKDFPIQALHAFGGPELAGTASGQARLTGPLAGPRGVLAAELQDLRLPGPVYQEVPPVTLHLNATLAEGSLQARLDAEGLGESPILARLSAPIVFSLSPFSLATVGNGKIDGHVTTSLPLEPMPGYLQWEGQKLAGRLHAALNLGGTSDSPALTGTIEIKEGMYEHSSAGTVVRDLALILGLNGDRITVKEGRATDGAEDGMQITGWMDINPKAGFPLEMDIKLQKTSLVRHDDLSVQTSGRIQLAGTLRKPFFRGTMGIEQAELRIPEKLPPDIANVEVTEINQPEGRVRQKPKPGKPVIIALDLSVDIPGRAFVRGRGLDSEWKGNLKVSGNTAEPIIKGNLSVVRGHFYFFDKRFTLRKGTLLFDGAAPPSPRFDVTAEYKRKDLTAYVDLSGTPEKPRIDLRSEPQYPSDEILARILFGRSASGITPVQAIKLANAMSALSGGGSAFDVMERTRRSIGIDTLDIKQAEGTEGGTAAAVGKYLGDNVYMEVEKGLGAETGKVTVEVEVTPNISVESEAGADASGGVGVNWKWDY